MRYKLKKILGELTGKKVLSIIQCTGPIPCISIEFNNCWIDIAVGVSPIDGEVHFPVHQIVEKDAETIIARREQLSK